MLTQFTENVFNGVLRRSYAEHSKETPQQTMLYNNKKFQRSWIFEFQFQNAGCYLFLFMLCFLAEVFDEFEFWWFSSFFRVNLAGKIVESIVPHLALN